MIAFGCLCIAEFNACDPHLRRLYLLAVSNIPTTPPMVPKKCHTVPQATTTDGVDIGPVVRNAYDYEVKLRVCIE